MWRPSTVVLAIAVPLGAQLGLSGCAMGGMGDQLPQSMGGLPQGAPARPETPYAYPRVYDTPGPRSTKPLDDAEQLRLQKELQGVRERQEKAAVNPDETPPPAQKPAKKTTSGSKSGQATGARTNP